MTFIRWFLGKLILTINFIFTPRGVKRSVEEQQRLDEQTQALSLYQFEACPFCVKVRRAMKRQSLKIALRDAKNDPIARAELEAGGGRIKVPCLRIERGESVEWLYESSDIIAYLDELVAATTAAKAPMNTTTKNEPNA